MRRSVYHGRFIATVLACLLGTFIHAQARETSEQLPLSLAATQADAALVQNKVKRKENALRRTNCTMPAVCRDAILHTVDEEGKTLNEGGRKFDCRANSPAQQSPQCNTAYRQYRLCNLYRRKPELFHNPHCSLGNEVKRMHTTK